MANREISRLLAADWSDNWSRAADPSPTLHSRALQGDHPGSSGPSSPRTPEVGDPIRVQIQVQATDRGGDRTHDLRIKSYLSALAAGSA